MRLLQFGLVVSLFAVSACGEVSLRYLKRPGEGPDEFLITPGKPLEAPESFAALPVPTPGGTNRTDQFPLQDSVAALGGTRQPATGSAPASDGGVINYVSRFGRDAAIRTELAEEDEKFRNRQGRFNRLYLIRRDLYQQIYRRQALDPQAELRKWRRAGAQTPSAPPEG